MKWSDEYEDQMNYKPNKKDEDPTDDELAAYDRGLGYLIIVAIGLLALAIGFGSREITKDATQTPAATVEEEATDTGRPYYDAPGNTNETFRENFGR